MLLYIAKEKGRHICLSGPVNWWRLVLISKCPQLRGEMKGPMSAIRTNENVTKNLFGNFMKMSWMGLLLRRGPTIYRKNDAK